MPDELREFLVDQLDARERDVFVTSKASSASPTLSS